ncbi:hypothetical protein [Yersinia pekkanenii]|uniref:Uncharacterized protein n=1 Tax=Yersinia pekkanenii TaxID=1288385 RepID=A0A0T9R031_9GAMM|nr:hypothetical protein [Yersinia pekkanenii]CNI37402.1 Uncharacterised protein [Yersinia pekkanenii]CRY66654.1 Uncharacterised protein [Yersinia pekkanenii]
MKPEKIDYGQISEYFIINDGGINSALMKVEAQIYVVNRHGIYKRYLSRRAAINKLAQVMATSVYKRLGLAIREDDIYDIERKAWIRGNLLHDYIRCRERAIRHILRLMAKQRETLKLNTKKEKQTDILFKKYIKAIDKATELEREIQNLNY